MTDCLKPDAGLLIMLGSMIVHADEYLSPGGHPLDLETFRSQLSRPEVQEWMRQMDAMAFLPRKRSETPTT